MQMRATFKFLGCSPCNLEVQTVTQENRKKNLEAHFKSSSVWGLQLPEGSWAEAAS